MIKVLLTDEFQLINVEGMIGFAKNNLKALQ